MNMNIRLNIVLACLVLWVSFSGPLSADQAAYISKSQAIKVEKILRGMKDIRFLCELCGETKSQAVKVYSVRAVDVNYENMWEVLVNKEGIDLAYTYIHVNNRWVNLARYVNEEVDSVSEFLSEKHL